MTSASHSGKNGMSTGAEVIALLKSSNAACCSVVHSNFAFTLVRHLSGLHLLEKLLMYLERYASICRNEMSSFLVLVACSLALP